MRASSGPGSVGRWHKRQPPWDAGDDRRPACDLVTNAAARRLSAPPPLPGPSAMLAQAARRLSLTTMQRRLAPVMEAGSHVAVLSPALGAVTGTAQRCIAKPVDPCSFFAGN